MTESGSPRTQRRILAVVGVLGAAASLWFIQDALRPAARVRPSVSVDAPAPTATRPVVAANAPSAPPPGSKGPLEYGTDAPPPAEHMAAKNREYAAREAERIAVEEAKYAGVDFAAPRPTAPEMIHDVQGKAEASMSPAEKADQKDRLVVLLKDRVARTEQHAAELREKGDAEAAAREEAIARRLKSRVGEVQMEAQKLRSPDGKIPDAGG